MRMAGNSFIHSINMYRLPDVWLLDKGKNRQVRSLLHFSRTFFAKEFDMKFHNQVMSALTMIRMPCQVSQQHLTYRGKRDEKAS